MPRVTRDHVSRDERQGRGETKMFNPSPASENTFPTPDLLVVLATVCACPVPWQIALCAKPAFRDRPVIPVRGARARDAGD